jgi:hypothetical protein
MLMMKRRFKEGTELTRVQVTKVWAAYIAERQAADIKEENGAERPVTASSGNAAAAPNLQPVLVH